MTRAVLDTNVLASGAVASRGAVAELTDIWLLQGRFIVVLSMRILAELERTLHKPYFARRVSNEDRERYLDTVRSAAEIVEPVTTPTDVPVASEDKHLFAAALAGGADFLVTGDQVVLQVGSYEGIAVVRPRDFLRALGP